MNALTAPALLTTEQLLAMPDDDTVVRELMRGYLKERPMTKRNRAHSRAEAKISHYLLVWTSEQPPPRGDVFAGEVGCILRRNPDTAVGIDVAYISADHAARQSDATTLIDGAPVLAVEILSPSDKQEDINEKIDEYLACGVSAVWIVDTHFRTVVVHRPGAQPELLNSSQQLSGDSCLPGFTVAVQDLFE